MLPGREPSRQRAPLSRPAGCADVALRYLFLIGAEIGPAQAHAAGIPAPGPPLLPSVATRIALIARRRFSARSQIVPPANSNLRPISMRDNQFTLPGYLVIDHTSAVRLRAGFRQSSAVRHAIAHAAESHHHLTTLLMLFLLLQTGIQVAGCRRTTGVRDAQTWSANHWYSGRRA